MFYHWLGGWLLRRRAWVLAALVLLTVGSLLCLPRLSFDFRPGAMLEFSEEEERFAAAFEARFGSSENLLMIVVHAAEGTVLDAAGLTVLTQLTDAVEASPAVAGAYSLVRVPRSDAGSGLGALLGGAPPPPLISALPVTEADAARVRGVVERSNVLRRQLVSDDGSTAVVVATLHEGHVEPVALDDDLASLEAELPEVLAEAARAAGRPGAFELRFGGLPYVRVETIRHMKSEQLLLWPLLGAAYFLLLLVIFRRLLQAVLPLVAVGFATAWSVGLIVVTGESVNMINNTLPTLILVVGVTNAIHVMIRIIDGKRRGLERDEAIRRAVSEIGLASLLTTLTTAIGFASLLVAHSELLRGFGWLTASGIMLTYVAIIALLPVLASLFRIRLPAHYERQQRAVAHSRLEAAMDRLSGPLLHHPRLVVGTAVGLLLVCGVLGARVPVDARAIDAFEEGHPVVQTNHLLESQLGGILPLEVDLRGAPGVFEQAEVMRRVARFEARVRQVDGVLSTLSLNDVLAEAGFSGDEGPSSDAAVAAGYAAVARVQPEVVARFVDAERSNTHVSVRLPDRGIRHSLRVIEELRAIAAEELAAAGGPALEVRLTGVAYLAAVGLDTFVRDLFYSLVTATVVIFFVLIGVFRSVRVGLLSLLPNLLPLATTLAVIPVFGYGLNTTTVVVFTIAIGLSVDNTIHLMARFQGEWAMVNDLDAAIRSTIRSTGRAIILSNLLLIGGFAILLVSDFEPIRRVGLLTMTTIGASLVVALVVLPAELKLFGRALRHR